ncbi:Alpha/Beta hydrolase protein [Leucosporidium creatinivorum]|uniref:Alpha/Beta hydrolase protein n=1 Tax=Leucosporidium creatinivorum TaxID=106004 RepID=A0A1Y2ENI9_9BASI|nr:Alpha/Beta hydrolase protein [Leucosporidium creatinivorum]
MQDTEDIKTAGSQPTTPTFPSSSYASTTGEEENVEERIARLATVRDITTLHKHTKYEDLPPAPAIRLEQLAAEPGLVAEAELEIEDFFAQSLQRLGLFLSFIHYSWGAFVAWWRSFLFAPLSFFSDPASTAGSIVIYPFVFSFLALCVFAFYVGSWLHIDRLVEYISKSKGDGLSIINWPNTSLFSSLDTAETVKSAHATLSGVATTFPDAPAPGKPAPGQVAARDMAAGRGLDLATNRIFDLDVAKTLLIMSALVYEVRDVKVREAQKAKQSNEAQDFLLKSEDFIKDQARHWGLRYLPMSGFKDNSDLGSKAGPFAGACFTPSGTKEPFVILCFKGTTPSNFTEFLIDCTISRVSSASFFGDGTGHEGFMRELFPIGRGRSDDYGQITRALRFLARDLSEKSSAKPEERKPVPLWITGHSLGAALAGLIYARWMHMPGDLGDDIVLKDGYTFGAPRFGDGAFVSKYEEASSSPIERPNVLWRVVNGYDIVTHIPPGFADAEENRPSISALSVLNYAHTGAGVKLDPFKKPFYKVDTTSLHSATRVVVVKDGAQGKPTGSRLPSLFPVLVKLIKWWNPLSWILAPIVLPVLLVTSAWNHFPSSYYDHLCQMNIDGQGGEQRRLATAKHGSASKTGADKKGGVAEKGAEKKHG